MCAPPAAFRCLRQDRRWASGWAGILLAGVTLLWTMPADQDEWLRASFWGHEQGSPDTLWLGVFDSLQAGAQESLHVNLGCVHMPQRWTFGMHVLSYNPLRPPSGPSNTTTGLLLP